MIKFGKDSIENCFKNFKARPIIINSDALKNNKSFILQEAILQIIRLESF